jgi:hypothetical protein
MNSKDIENKIKGLYKGIDPSHFEADDKKILRYEKQSIEFSERYHNDPEFKKIIQEAHEKRHDNDNWVKNVTKNAKALAKKHKDPEWRAKWEENYYESRERLKANPEHKKMMTERNRQMAKDPKWHKALVKSRAPMSDKDSDWYKRIKKANQKKAKLYATEGTPQRERFMAGREKMKNDPTWKMNMCKGNGGKPVSTPWGKLYMCPPDASKDSENYGEFYSAKKIRIRCDKKTEGFKWISWKEYEN